MEPAAGGRPVRPTNPNRLRELLLLAGLHGLP